MAFAISVAFLLFFHICSLCQGESFVFNGFNGSEGSLKLEGGSVLKPTGILRLTTKERGVIRHAFYNKHITMYHKNSSSFPNASSFSTEIVFAIVSPSSGTGGFGLAFTLSPSPSFPGAEAGHYFRIFNSSNDNKSSNHILAVEFDTVNGYKESSNTDGNHVGIDINSVYSAASEPAAYNTAGAHKEEVKMESGNPIHAWIDYDGEAQVLNVTVSPINKGKPSEPLLSHAIDLSSVLQQTMYAGFSASTGNDQSSSHYIIGWSFAVNGIASKLNLSDLPIPPKDKSSSSSYSPRITALIVGLSVVVFLLLAILFFFTLYRRLIASETLEDWEIDCPHRFRYKDLHAATKGFQDSNEIGAGGCGAVYKGVLPSTGCDVAVKKISRNGIQGMRELVCRGN